MNLTPETIDLIGQAFVLLAGGGTVVGAGVKAIRQELRLLRELLEMMLDRQEAQTKQLEDHTGRLEHLERMAQDASPDPDPAGAGAG